MADQLFLEPLDVLYLRGNKLFGDPGSHGEALMPPWPSVAAGAIRSRMLADGGVDLAAFAQGRPIADDRLRAVLGTPTEPGSFRLTLFTLARRMDGHIEPLFPAPADLVIDADHKGKLIRPRAVPAGVICSNPTASMPILVQDKQSKPKTGLWLTAPGMEAYLAGRVPDASLLVAASDLWKTDPRLGIALNGAKRSAAHGMIYTAESVALQRKGRDTLSGKERFDTGFLVCVMGTDGMLPADGLLRFGGDGRGAAVSSVHADLPHPDWGTIERTGKFRVLLTSPGLFQGGWRLPGLDENGMWTGPQGCTATLAAAGIPRAQIISGWDMAKWQPKPALRAVPSGGIYWFEAFKGDIATLRELANTGFWAYSDYPDRQRRAEGFNNLMIAAWPQE